MNLQKHDSKTEMEMDMTPMIDVVFLLIIFFMVITDLSQQDLEDLQLPMAEHAVPDKPKSDEWRPILNVKHTGVMIQKRTTYFDPELNTGPRKYDELKNQLLAISNRMKKAPFAPGSSTMIPDEPLLIRADESTNFKFVQDIMEQCGDKNISIWKLQLAVSVPEQ
ncbi:MAG: biopolymer transporter ExbD [Planctomycetota bacterium]